MATARTKKEEVKTVLAPEVTESVSASEPNVAPAKPAEDDGRVDYLLPMHILGDEEEVEACLNGKVYQIRCGEVVRIPKGLAEVLDNAIAQTKKVNALRRDREKNTKEITQ